MKRILFFALAVGTNAVADGQHHHGPPPEAIAACKSLAAGAACTVAFGDHTMDGTCHAGPDSVVACRPNGPPKEAVDACSSKAVGDICSVTFGDHTMDGTCRNDHDGKGALACAPKHHEHD